MPAQNLRDSLLQEINLTNVNAKKADIYFELVTMYIGQDRDSAEYFLEKAHRYMDADSDARLQALSNSLVVEIYRNDGVLIL